MDRHNRPDKDDLLNRDRLSNVRPGEVDAGEAAAYLGIKRSSLYTYVSRGLLRGVRRAGYRGRLYPMEELKRFERARSEGELESYSAASLASTDLLGRVGEWPQASSARQSEAITEVLGLRVEDLAEQLWTGEQPIDLVPWNSRGLGLIPSDIAGALPSGAPPLDCLPLALAALAARDADRFGAPAEAELYRARRLCLRLTALLAMSSDVARCSVALRSDSLAGVFLAALGVDDRGPRRAFVDAALGLAALQPADDADEVVVRSTASGVDLYSSLQAGLSLMSGPEGVGACGRVEALVVECELAHSSSRAVSARYRRGEDIPGFAERTPSPRDLAASGAGLLAALRSFPDADCALAPLADLVDFMENSGRGRVCLPVVLVAVERALALPRGSSEVLLVLGRIITWVGLVLRSRRRS
jgi:citrate synthase